MKFIKEPVNTFTHFIGFVLSILALIFMLIKSLRLENTLYIISSAIFGSSLILLYLASTLHHMIKSGEKIYTLLRKIDHSMIYVLIAGTYTPICLITLQGTLGTILFSIIWSIAVIGIIIKFFWLNAPRILYTSFYLVMGWISVFFMFPIYKSLEFSGFLLLAIGGISYTIGAIFYAFNFPKHKHLHFGSHEIFHLFVIVGSLSHYIMISRYIIN